MDKVETWRHIGAMTNTRTNVAALDRINLRLAVEAFEAIDAARSNRPGRISRNTWIAEAIEEKLVRDALAQPEPTLRKAGNA